MGADEYATKEICAGGRAVARNICSDFGRGATRRPICRGLVQGY